jgi:hypothetical protein
MVINKEYTCGCGLNFGNKKDHWERHLNRKFPCKVFAPKNTQITQNTLKEHKNIQICVEIKNENIQENIQDEKNKLKCEYCLKVFSRKFSLDRHLHEICKLKPNPNQPNPNQSNPNQSNPNQSNPNQSNPNQSNPNQPNPNQPNQLNQPNILSDSNSKIDYILKKLNHLEDENKKLKKQIKRTKKSTNIKIVNNNNTINNINNNIVNFNDFNYNGVDKKLFIQPIMNSKLFGKSIILQMIENIYINETHPEYHNLIVTDKNRGYVKIYNNGKWKTDNINTINMIIDGIISHSKTILVELKQQYLNNLNVKSRLNTSEKYINLCDLEYLCDLEDEEINDGINNKNQIQRCKDFREMIYKDTINMFHDSKEILVKHKIIGEKNNDSDT